MIIQQADGKIENSDKRTERWTDGRVEDGIDDCGGGGTFPGRWEWDDATLPSLLLLCGRSGDKLQCLCRDDWKRSVAGTPHFLSNLIPILQHSVRSRVQVSCSLLFSLQETAFAVSIFSRHGASDLFD